MDPADLHQSLREPDRESPDGAGHSPRLNFVAPPEVRTAECASLQARAKALAIDALLWVAAVILLGILFGGISSTNGFLRIKIVGSPMLMATVLWLAYMTMMEGRYGASLGKRARGLRVVMEDGGPASLEASLIRNLMRFLDAFPYGVPYLVGAVAASNSPLMQRFGDRIAETMVVVSVPATPDPAATSLQLLGSNPRQEASARRKRRLLMLAVVTLAVLAVGAVAAFLLMR